jgi:nitrate/nitrite transporter NarK
LFLSGAEAAAGIALINTIGNFAGFATPYLTGLVKDATGSYQVPMFIVGGFMLISAILTFAIGATASRDSKIALNKNQAVGLKPKLE